MKTLLSLVLCFSSILPTSAAPPPDKFVYPTGQTWTIKVAKCWDIPLQSLLEKVFQPCSLEGLTDEKTHTIWIQQGLPPEKTKEVLLHELMHAVLGTKYSDEVATLHFFIYITAPRIQSLLQANPQLMQYLGNP